MLKGGELSHWLDEGPSLVNLGGDKVGGDGVKSDMQDESDQKGQRGLSAWLGDGLSLEKNSRMIK